MWSPSSRRAKPWLSELSSRSKGQTLGGSFSRDVPGNNQTATDCSRFLTHLPNHGPCLTHSHGLFKRDPDGTTTGDRAAKTTSKKHIWCSPIRQGVIYLNFSNGTSSQTMVPSSQTFPETWIFCYCWIFTGLQLTIQSL